MNHLRRATVSYNFKSTPCSAREIDFNFLSWTVLYVASSSPQRNATQVFFTHIHSFSGMSADFPLTQKYSRLNPFALDTGQWVHIHPAWSTVSSAFPFAQKRQVCKGEFLNVGQFGHMHIFRFSLVSATTMRIQPPSKGFWATLLKFSDSVWSRLFDCAPAVFCITQEGILCTRRFFLDFWKRVRCCKKMSME